MRDDKTYLSHILDAIGTIESYATSEKLAPLVREIAWSHNIVIIERCVAWSV